MTKNIFLSVLFLSLLSCGKSGNSSNSASIAGNEQANSPQTSEDYSPIGLSDKVFVQNGRTHAPMDFISQKLTLTFDPVSQTAKGKSLIKFKLKKNGHPYFELQSTITSIRLDSSLSSTTTIKDPDGQNQSYWSLDQELSAGQVHEVELEYQLASGRVSFTNGGVGFLTDMTDLNGKFFEYWGPVGFEEDAFALNLDLKVTNSTATHQLFTNGSSAANGTQSWNIIFPDYFSKSSFYVHLTNTSGLTVKKFTYQGIEKSIPVEVYGITATLVNSAVAELPKLFAELEKDYGGYGHSKFVAYMNDRSGGMEYVGATITSLASLDHELLHSWFARSVIPADGRSGWIDEAMASWRDYGYTRASSVLNRTPTNLASYSPYRKSTPSNSYVDGRALMAELDSEFASAGGLKPVMKSFFKKYKNRVINNEEFWSFLESHTGKDLQPFNLRYALSEAEDTSTRPVKAGDSKHPTPLTQAEILKLR